MKALQLATVRRTFVGPVSGCPFGRYRDWRWCNAAEPDRAWRAARCSLVRAEWRWRCAKKRRGRSAADFLKGARTTQVEVMSFQDGFFPEHGEAIKSWFEALKSRVNPDVIFTHYRDDAHQDHRHVCRLTWNTFRDHCILEYEIPKWDGDMGQPNVYMPVSAAALERKIELLNSHFGSQRSKQWFDSETFHGLARLRGMECRASERYAEAFFARKLTLI